MDIVITIRKAYGRYEIAFPYNPSIVNAVRELPERRWNKNARTWSVPASSARQLKAWTDRIKGARVHWDDVVKKEIEAIVEKEEVSIVASRQSESFAEIPVPEGLEYLPYQKAGIQYALGRPGTLIGDEMGLGKTIQAIGVANCTSEITSVLIICPASLKLNWKREWEKWSVHKMNVEVVTPQSRYLPYAMVTIINYDLLKNHLEAIHRRAWDLLIVDEAHYIKSSKANRTLMVVGGKKKSKKDGKTVITEFKKIEAARRLFLTGTPILNKPVEAWTLIHALAPVNFSSFSSYAYRYCGATHNGYGFEAKEASNLPELQDRLRATIMVRRLKADVLTELPAKRRQIIELECDTDVVSRESAAYERSREALEALKLAVELAKGGTDEEYRTAVDALNQGAMAQFSEMAKLRHETALAKLPQVIEHLQDAIESSGKIVCFAWHKDVIAGIAKAFPGCLTMTGDTPMAQRQADVDRFQQDSKCELFVLNMGAGGVGHTLTAASHVIFAELDWVPGQLSQCEDRCHRIGQKDSVLVQHLVLEGSLDATMAKRIVAKQKILDMALDKEIEPAVALPIEIKNLPATEDVPRKQIIADAELLTAGEIESIHAGLKKLSMMCDGANSEDGTGFNRMDTAIGKSLAKCERLTARQAAVGKRLVHKYRRQLGGS